GKDNVFGKKYFKNISDKEDNQLGLLWDDPASHDDLVVNQTMYLVVGRPVKLIINSRDVIHDVGLAHFRMKMDAVPGTPTTMWFTPKYTTEEMRKKLNDPEFDYELSCDQMCGRGHFSMKGVVKVVTPDEFILWRAREKPNYARVMNANPPAPTSADTTKVSSIKPNEASVAHTK
ncbi:MAG TPA: cytochrome c oxidase subunit II, partial [Puia sp.]|nr:cytochrome c oxidase subunit II [Puia sp.]